MSMPNHVDRQWTGICKMNTKTVAAGVSFPKISRVKDSSRYDSTTAKDESVSSQDRLRFKATEVFPDSSDWSIQRSRDTHPKSLNDRVNSTAFKYVTLVCSTTCTCMIKAKVESEHDR